VRKKAYAQDWNGPENRALIARLLDEAGAPQAPRRAGRGPPGLLARATRPRPRPAARPRCADARRATAPGPRLPQLAAARASPWRLAGWRAGASPVRATVPVAVPAGAAGGVDGPGAVHAVVEGPAAAILVLRVRPPALRDGVLVGGAAAAAAPGDVVLPRGAGAVTVHAVVVGRADQRAARAP
jgi:hypothetical protein